ncbi:MAG TPA: hypothetical protein VFD51_03415 [Patescibacteria group bacterium]|nr:hypothetical protein [Patescibacteria group bacterium]
MKKTILPVLAIGMLMAMPVLAILPAGPIPDAQNIDIWALLTKALNWFFNITIIVAAIFLVFAGWQYVTAGGDEDKMKNGLNTLIRALIGVGIALLAKGLIYIVSTFIIDTGVTF